MIEKKFQIAGAPVVMRKRGKETDDSVLEEVERKPSSTVREIATRLGWSNGRVDGSVNRLVSQGRIKVRHHLKRGTLVKKVYPLRHIPTPPNIVEIPTNMIDADLWKDTVNVYALSRSTVALSPVQVDEWEEKALRKEKGVIVKNRDVLQIEISGVLSDFYQLENAETSISTTASFAMVTVESVLPVILPSTYPAETTFEYTRLLMVEKIKGITSHIPDNFDLDLVEDEVSFTIPYESQLVEKAKISKKERKVLTASSETSEAPMIEVA
jgi:hypothetical protein